MAFAALFASLVAAVVAGAAAVYPQAGDASRERAEDAVLPGNRVVAETANELEHAEKLDDLAEASAAARAAIADLELLDTAGIGDSRFRGAARRLLRAQLELLSALAPLADLDESTVGKWQRHRRRIGAAVRQIERAHPAVAALGLAPELNVWGPVLRWSLANADAVAARAWRRLGIWRARVQQIRRRQSQALAAVTSYDSGVGGHLATYDSLRGNPGDRNRRVKRIRDGIAALHPPAEIASAHADLLASLRPRSEPDAGARASAAARSKWQAAVAREVKRINSTKLPKRPDV